MGRVDTVIERAFQLLIIPEPIPAYQWAAENRFLPSEVTAVQGMYDPEFAPFQKEPQDSFFDDDVQVTVLQWAARQGKTECINNLEGCSIDRDPSNILVAYPTIDSSEKWAKEMFEPMRDNTPSIKAKISEPKSRDGDNTIRSKKFPGGRISAIGTNSPSGFRQIQARIVIADEIDAMEDGKEGDPITLLFKRADNYADSIQVLASTPTIKGLSRIQTWFEKGDQRYWFVKCCNDACGHWQTLKWEQLDWSKQGTRDDPRYICEECGHAHNDKERVRMVRNGEWRPTATFNGVRSYHLNGLYSVFPAKKGFKNNKMIQFVEEFYDAKEQGSQGLQVWTNTFKAEVFDDSAEQMDYEAIHARAEHYDPSDEPIPDGSLMLVLGADVQGSPARIEAEVVAYGEGFESWGLGYYQFMGDLEDPETWKPFRDLLEKQWKLYNGGSLKLARGFIDMGHRDDLVLPFCKSCLAVGIKLYPVRGKGTEGRNTPPIVGRPSKNNRLRLPHYMIGDVATKKSVYADVAREPGGSHTCHFPKGNGYDLEYYRQLVAAERLVMKYQGGRPYQTFINPEKLPNEALDIRKYAYAAAVSLDPRWNDIAKNVEKLATKQKEEARVAPKPLESARPVAVPRPYRQQRRTSFVNRWRHH
ncbi:phage terminase large subunit family protein [Rubellicoccus peritrichatus]|uniref:Terminase gpA endonuclease subunit n=1 Tax=Rubellicoccus peritrichatus TaxID=3080537 RepID=A0AAQ3L6T2_9BACT|nr:terminase gpA endonuclease subunit [Puniceicoccus sp. CR14]WOO40385.1 terminase gpA endonuclease subunit [Puniceicoccus sp. CR14]WOO40434.1 terminase gpA endonuclease subunit [Puniceicoccus sp. CR14]WOO40483.1 terminase gpA endonuclease subunit [Puniceicoccus sp. CR14]WOO40532.1 terminase gpA endonuclease subunit [Puniceicoccus sp. CR14]